MKISPRNQLYGVVQGIQQGAVSSTVDVEIGNAHLVACLSNAGIAELGLSVGDPVLVIISAFDVVIVDPKTPSINTIAGTIHSISLGATCAEITVGIDEGNQLTAIVLNREVALRLLQVGNLITVSINPMKIFIGVDE